MESCIKEWTESDVSVSTLSAACRALSSHDCQTRIVENVPGMRLEGRRPDIDKSSGG